jgi:hypothetical protein
MLISIGELVKMSSCPACNHELPNRANLVYCPICGAQTKCKACHVDLERGDIFCVSCGTAVGSGEQSMASHVSSNHSQPLNTLEYREESKGRSRSLVTTFTDVVGTALGGTMLAVITDSHSSTVGARKTYNPGYEAKAMNNTQLSLPVIPPDIDGIVMDTSAHPISNSHEYQDDEERLKKVFSGSGEAMRLFDNRLKAKNKKDYSHRLVSLFLYYNQVMGNVEIERSAIIDQLKKAGSYDKNSSTLLKEFSDSEWRDEDGVFSLYPAGIEVAKRFLDEVHDSEIPSEWNPGKSGGNRSLKPTIDEKGEHFIKKRKNDTKCPMGEELAGKWKTSPALSIDTKTVKHLAVAKQGIVGLWAIHRLTEGQQNNISVATLSSFYYFAFGLEVNQANLSKRLGEIVGKGLLIKNNGGFQLLSDGIEEAEKIVQKVH